MRRQVSVTLLVLAAALLFMLSLQLAQLRGTDTDLFPRWYGLRQLLLHQRDPYGGEVTREIAAQTSFLQRRLSETHAPSSVEISYGFLYPLPGVLLIGPLALLPYHVALASWFA
ncbi:MAG TPA: hypothetical protein VGW38_10870, partial [Chloroflexota bacterium]|nr:hypothetical protein [Chloroflexota bacterium]